MNITAPLLKTGIKVTFKNKTVKYIGVKIGAVTGSHIKDGKIWVDVSIDKDVMTKLRKIIKKSNILSIEIGNEKWIKQISEKKIKKDKYCICKSPIHIAGTLFENGKLGKDLIICALCKKEMKK